MGNSVVVHGVFLILSMKGNPNIDAGGEFFTGHNVTSFLAVVLQTCTVGLLPMAAAGISSQWVAK
jgi:hypothetical protein